VIISNRALLLAKTPLILKQLYDDDIISEETLLEWGKKVQCFVCFHMLYL
jgi:hypothetical protein